MFFLVLPLKIMLIMLICGLYVTSNIYIVLILSHCGKQVYNGSKKISHRYLKQIYNGAKKMAGALGAQLDKVAEPIHGYDTIIVLPIIVALIVPYKHLVSATNPLMLALALLTECIVPMYLGMQFALKFDRVKEWSKSPATKTIATVIGLVFAWIARAEIAGLLNERFHIDASNFPLALTAGIFIRLAGYLALFAIIVSLAFQFTMLLVFFRVGNGNYKIWRGINIILYFTALFFGFYFSSRTLQAGLNSVSTFLTYRFAYEYDFNSAYFCEGVPKDAKVVFIGPEGSIALAATALEIKNAPYYLSAEDRAKLFPTVLGEYPCNRVGASPHRIQ